MGEVTAVVQAQAEHRVARFEEGLVHRHVGVSARMRLDVGVVGTEQGLDPFASQVLHLVHMHVAAVVPLAWVALGVLVGQDRPAGFQYGRRGEILRSDELQRGVLPFDLLVDVAEQFVVS